MKIDSWNFRISNEELSDVYYENIHLATSLRPAIRDVNWETYEPEDVVVKKDSNSIEIKATYSVGVAESLIAVESNKLSYSYKFTATSNLPTNRTGITLMIPASYSGLDAEITDSQEKVNLFRFPQRVSPWQPAKDIKRIYLQEKNAQIDFSFYGDYFEMEDQRNWHDSSYKIYNRDLSLPFPYEIKKDEIINQKIIITVTPAVSNISENINSYITKAPTKQTANKTLDLSEIIENGSQHTVPPISIGASTVFNSKKTVSTFAPSSITAEFAEGYPLEKFTNSLLNDSNLGEIPIDLMLATTKENVAKECIKALKKAKLQISSVMCVDPKLHITTPECMLISSEIAALCDAKIVVGARTHFAEFNRNIKQFSSKADSYRYTYTPQMHVTEPWHIIDSCQIIKDTVQSAREYIGNSPLILGPITLKARVNSVSTEPGINDQWEEDGYGANYIASSIDERAGSTWAETWTALCISHAIGSDVDALVFYEMFGPRGIHDENGSLTPEGILLKKLNDLKNETVIVNNSLIDSKVSVMYMPAKKQLFLINASNDDISFKMTTQKDSEVLVIPANEIRNITVTENN